jgi:hypothetical protein
MLRVKTKSGCENAADVFSSLAGDGVFADWRCCEEVEKLPAIRFTSLQ